MTMTPLSSHALIGTRKQSVSDDVEQIFSAGVLTFMERKGYSFQTEYVCDSKLAEGT